MVSSDGSLRIPEERYDLSTAKAGQAGRPYRSTGRRLVPQLLAICVVFALSMPYLVQNLPVAPAITPVNRETPPARVPSLPLVPWKVWMDVKEHSIIADQVLFVAGDIIVRKDAELDLINCNVTMNGTFYVQGRLELRNTRISCFPADYGYSAYNFRSPAITTNLTDCHRASFDFILRSWEYTPIWLDVISNGARTEKVWSSEIPRGGIVNATVDLSDFCGGVCELDFCTTGSASSIDLIRPEIVTDRFTTGPRDLIVDRPGADYPEAYTPRTFPYEFYIKGAGGSISIVNCTLDDRGSGAELLDARGTTLYVSGTAFGSPGDDTSYGSMSLVLCNARILDSSFEGGQLELESSVAEITGSSFSNGYQAISASDTDLSVSGCRFSGCAYGVRASVDMFRTGGTVIIRDSFFNATDTALRLDDVKSSLEGCSIQAPVPVLIFPRSTLTRASCTLENVTSLKDNRITALPGYSEALTGEPEKVPPTAVTFVSAIPVSGLERLALSNELNGTDPAARYIEFNMSVNRPDGFSNLDVLQFNSTGSVRELDHSLHSLGVHDFSDGWQTAFETEYYSSSDSGQPISLWGILVPADRLETDGSGYALRQLDESDLQVKVHVGDLAGTVDVDARDAERPPDIPNAGSFRSPFDLSLADLTLSYDRDLSLVNIPVTVSVNGSLDFNSSRVVCTLDGRTLEDFITPAWTGEYALISEDLANVSSGGEIALRIVPTNGEDSDLTNNVVHSWIHVLNESTTLGGDVDLTGLWLLGPDVDLTFENCVGYSGGDVSIAGMGNNRLDIRSSIFNISSLGLDVDSGLVQDSEIVANYSSWGTGSYHVQSFLEIDNGTWEFGNTTFGLSASDYARLEPDFTGGENTNQPPFGELELGLYGEALSCDDCSFLAPIWSGLTFNSSVNIRNCSCPLGDGMWLSARNITLEDNRFEIYELTLEANGTVLIDGNSFTGTEISFQEAGSGSEVEIINNEIKGDPLSWSYAGVYLDGNGNISIDNNSFSDLDTGVLIYYPAPLPARIEQNSFSNISFARAYSESEVMLELDFWNLSLMLNRQVTGAQVSWNDSGYSGSSSLSIQHGQRSGEGYLELPYYFVGPDGHFKEFRSLTVNVVVESASGINYSFYYSIPFRGMDSWTETIG